MNQGPGVSVSGSHAIKWWILSSLVTGHRFDGDYVGEQPVA